MVKQGFRNNLTFKIKRARSRRWGEVGKMTVKEVKKKNTSVVLIFAFTNGE